MANRRQMQQTRPHLPGRANGVRTTESSHIGSTSRLREYHASPIVGAELVVSRGPFTVEHVGSCHRAQEASHSAVGPGVILVDGLVYRPQSRDQVLRSACCGSLEHSISNKYRRPRVARHSPFQSPSTSIAGVLRSIQRESELVAPGRAASQRAARSACGVCPPTGAEVLSGSDAVQTFGAEGSRSWSKASGGLRRSRSATSCASTSLGRRANSGPGPRCGGET